MEAIAFIGIIFGMAMGLFALGIIQ